MPDRAITGTGRTFMTIRMVFHEWRQQLPLLDPHKSLVQLGMFREVLSRLLGLIMILGIIKHRRTHTVLTLLAHEDLVVDTAFTACPEIFILRQLGIGHRLI